MRRSLIILNGEYLTSNVKCTRLINESIGGLVNRAISASRVEARLAYVLIKRVRGLSRITILRRILLIL